MALGTPLATSSEGTGSFSHDSGSGSDRVLLVCPKTLHDSSGDGVTAVTYNGVSMTAVTSSYQEAAFGGRFGSVEWFYLINPASGSNTVALTTSGTIRDSQVIAITVPGADQTTPIVSGSTAVTTTTSATATFTVSTGEANSQLFMGAAWRGGDIDPFTPGTDVTELSDGSPGENSFINLSYTDVYRSTTSTGSYTISTTGSASDILVAAVIELAEAGGGGGGPSGTPIHYYRRFSGAF